MTGWTYAEEEAATAALVHLSWELRFMAAKARLVLDGGSLDAETTRALTAALGTMKTLREQLEAVAGPRAARRPETVGRD